VYCEGALTALPAAGHDYARRFTHAQSLIGARGRLPYASVMQYIPPAFSRNGGPVIETIPAGARGGEGLAGRTGLRLLGRRQGNDPPTDATFHYTFGRWSDNGAASHTIKVIPGNGSPTFPNSAPQVATSAANFVQLVPYSAVIAPSGTGSVVDIRPAKFGANFYVAVDAVNFPAPKHVSSRYDRSWTSKSPHTLAVPASSAPFSVNSRYVFARWSDGGAIAHSIASLPAAATSYVATGGAGIVLTLTGTGFTLPHRAVRRCRDTHGAADGRGHRNARRISGVRREFSERLERLRAIRRSNLPRGRRGFARIDALPQVFAEMHPICLDRAAN
jgi:hypothetical protein